MSAFIRMKRFLNSLAADLPGPRPAQTLEQGLGDHWSPSFFGLHAACIPSPAGLCSFVAGPFRAGTTRGPAMRFANTVVFTSLLALSGAALAQSAAPAAAASPGDLPIRKLDGH